MYTGRLGNRDAHPDAVWKEVVTLASVYELHDLVALMKHPLSAKSSTPFLRGIPFGNLDNLEPALVARFDDALVHLWAGTGSKSAVFIASPPILVARSEFFRGLFAHEWGESVSHRSRSRSASRNDVETSISDDALDLGDVNLAHFGCMLHFIYTETFETNPATMEITSLLELLSMGGYFGCGCFADAVALALVTHHVTTANVCTIWHQVQECETVRRTALHSL
jgi:hypothetical protein